MTKKFLAGAIAAMSIVSLSGFGLVAMPTASAATTAELQAQIAALLAQIASLQTQIGGGASASYTFTRDLTVGSQGEDVRQLQIFLNAHGSVVASTGAGSPGSESTYFGPLTASALAKFQAANGIAPAAGYFGPITRAKVHAMMGTGGGTTPPPTSGGGDDNLDGGAGSVEEYNVMSDLNNEEVGEDEEDVEVYGLEIEADDGSDLEFTAVRVNFEQGTGATHDFEDYASEVSIWFDGEEVGRVDGDEFDEDNNFEKTISLDDGAILDAGETGELVVAVSGVSNLDSADVGDEWNVHFNPVRFMDADGANISEDPDEGSRDFSFESFATASDTELKISLGDDEVNDARAIEVDATDDTDDVELLSFMIEAEGDSDITIDSLPINIDTTETTGNDPDDLIGTLNLVVDGDEIGSENMDTSDVDDSDETVVFDDLDWTIPAGDEVEVVVTATLFSIADALDAGDTIAAEIGETETDSADFDAEDESGEDLADADITGAADGDAHTVYATAFVFELVSVDADVTTEGDPVASPATSDIGTFAISYDLTAFGGDVNIDKSCEEADADAADQGTEYTVTNAGSNSTSCSVSSTADTATGDSDAWTVEEDETERFTLTVAATASADHFAKVYLVSINFEDDTTTPDTSPDLFTTASLGEDKTSTAEIFLNDN